MVEGWDGLRGGAGWALLGAAVLTWPVCWVLLLRYRALVREGMRATGRGRASAPLDRPAARAQHDAERLLALVRERVRRARRDRLLAVLAYGGTAVLALQLNGARLDRPVQLVVALAYAVPLLVPTLLSAGPTRRATEVLLWAGYAAVLVGPPLLLGDGLGSALGLAGVTLVTLLVVLGTAPAAARSAAWLVVPVVLAGGLVVAGVVAVLGSGTGALAVGAVLVPASALLLLCVLLVLRRWRGRTASDEVLRLSQWWVTLSVVQAVLQGQRPTDLLLALLPAPVFLLALGALLRRHREVREPPPRLVLLRAFDRPRATADLLRAVARGWQWVGEVCLVTGPDSAGETLEPDALLDVLRGRLRERFIGDADQLAARLQELDGRPLEDGRHRRVELRCRDDVWRHAVRRLLLTADVVLVDLRGYAPGRVGLQEELALLVAHVPSERVVVVVPRGGPERYVAARPGLPPVEVADAQLARWHQVRARRDSVDERALLEALCRAAGGVPPAAVPEQRRARPAVSRARARTAPPDLPLRARDE